MMTPNEAKKWLHIVRAVDAPRARLLCFSYAGGGASVFNAWRNLAPELEVCAVQLPGRQERLNERGVTSVPQIVDAITAALRSRAPAPLALYGHSFGALVAFEVALRRKEEGAPPIALVVGARTPPAMTPRRPFLHALPHDAFVRAIHQRYGTALDLLQHPDLAELIVPPLRADFTALETYAFAPGSKLDVPITVLHGRLDAASDGPTMRGWQEVTSLPIAYHEVDAGHFFIDTHRPWVQARVTEALAAVL